MREESKPSAIKRLYRHIMLGCASEFPACQPPVLVLDCVTESRVRNEKHFGLESVNSVENLAEVCLITPHYMPRFCFRLDVRPSS